MLVRHRTHPPALTTLHTSYSKLICHITEQGIVLIAFAQEFLPGLLSLSSGTSLVMRVSNRCKAERTLSQSLALLFSLSDLRLDCRSVVPQYLLGRGYSHPLDGYFLCFRVGDFYQILVARHGSIVEARSFQKLPNCPKGRGLLWISADDDHLE